MSTTGLETAKGSIAVQCSLLHTLVEGVLIHLMYHKHGAKIAEMLADQNALDSDFE